MSSRIEDTHSTHSRRPRDQLYQGLNLSGREIRLVELLPGRHNDFICCHMIVASLDDEVEYKALSYNWGDPDITLSICVNGCILPSTLNLESALRQFRSTDANVILWIDAICINQLDVPERNQQVAIMAEIYSQATEVMVWLGKDFSSSTLGLNLRSDDDSASVLTCSRSRLFGLAQADPVHRV